MKKVVIIALGYMVNSLFPILSWVVWGIFIDKDISVTFTLTYPVQFIWGLIWALLGHGAFTNALKKNNEEENWLQGGLKIGVFIYLLVMLLLLVFGKQYIRLMQFDVDRYLIPYMYSVIEMMLCGIATLCSIYWCYKDNENRGSIILIIFNFIAYASLMICLVLSNDSLISSVVSVALTVVVTLVVVLGTMRRHKVKFNLFESMRYAAGDIVQQFGLFVVYLFGIFDLTASVSALLVSTFNAWVQITDWVWDVLGNTIPVLVRVDSVKGRYSFKSTLYKITVLLGILLIVIFSESLFMISVFDINIKYLIFFGVCDIIDMILYAPRCIMKNNLSTTDSARSIAVAVGLSYVIRIICTVLLPANVAMYLAQVISGAGQLIMFIAISKRAKNKESICC